MAERGYVTSPRSHSCEVTENRFQPRFVFFPFCDWKPKGCLEEGQDSAVPT